jgi:acetyl esterase
MALDEATKAVLKLMEEADRPELWTLNPAAARAQVDPLTEASEHEPEEMAQVENRSIPGPAGDIPVRIYTPVESAAPLPVLVFYHGGGFVIGTLDTHDSACRTLARAGGCITVAVDYRMGPEARFPAAVDDGYAALEWVAAHAGEFGGDPARLAVGGDSAGGNIAAVVAQLARDRNGPKLAYQLLIYPATDARRDAGLYASYKGNSQGYMLTHDLMSWFESHYISDAADKTDPRMSPLLADSLAGLPPAFVVTAGFDPLLDEGKAYADRLAEAGVPVEYHCYENTIHGFINMGRFIPTAVAALEDMGRRLKTALAG